MPVCEPLGVALAGRGRITGRITLTAALHAVECIELVCKGHHLPLTARQGGEVMRRRGDEATR
jgi:hypothetical protein